MKKLIVRVNVLENNKIYLTKGVKIENGMIICDGKKLAFPINNSRGELDGAGCNNYEQVVATNDTSYYSTLYKIGDFFNNEKYINNIPEIVLLDFNNEQKKIKLDNNGNVIISEARMFNMSEVYDMCQLALATPCDNSNYADSWCDEYILNIQD